MIYKIVEEGALEAETIAAAAALASKPPQALQISRDLLRRGMRDASIERIRQESAIFGERLGSPEAKAAFEAFMARKSAR